MAKTTRLDRDWRFLRSDAEGAEVPEFDDSGWRVIEVPHDWSIECVPGTDSPFHDQLSGGKIATGHVVGGTGWYRRILDLQPEAGKRHEIRFDGVYMNADIWVNGTHVAFHPYGYTQFAVDLTPHLREGGRQLIAVRVRNEGHNARWYTGSGLFRHVWLVEAGSAQIPMDGLKITTPEVSASRGVVKTTVEVERGEGLTGAVELRLMLLDPEGNEVARQVLPTAGDLPSAQFELPFPRLWYPWDVAPEGRQGDQPLYSLTAQLWIGGTLSDEATSRFGFRKVEVDPQMGLRINGMPVLLKGGCVHHDNGILGAVAIPRADERRVELLKAAGYNAVRTSHNPPSPAFLDACDRMGLLVMDEVHDEWETPKAKDGYTASFGEWAEIDAKAMVRRDRNRPSVIFWSIGNEILDCFDRPDIALKLRQAVLAEDETRPITAGVCTPWWPTQTYKDWETSSDPAFEHLDAAGYNYIPHLYEPDHQRHPERMIMGTESFPLEAWSHWEKVERLPYVLGDFVWTALDYIGESAIGLITAIEGQPTKGEYPFHLAVCGDLDILCHRKPQSYYRESLWRKGVVWAAVRHPSDPKRRFNEDHWGHKWGWRDVASHWNWQGHEGETLTVEVYTSCPRVAVYLNSRLVAVRELEPEDQNLLLFEVPYEPGVLQVSGQYQGVERIHRLETAGKPAQLRLSPDRAQVKANRDDLCFVTLTVDDENGIRVPDASVRVALELEGPAELLAFGNADPVDVEDLQDPSHRTWQGTALAVIRATAPGEITLKASGEGMAEASAILTATD